MIIAYLLFKVDSPGLPGSKSLHCLLEVDFVRQLVLNWYGGESIGSLLTHSRVQVDFDELELGECAFSTYHCHGECEKSSQGKQRHWDTRRPFDVWIYTPVRRVVLPHCPVSCSSLRCPWNPVGKGPLQCCAVPVHVLDGGDVVQNAENTTVLFELNLLMNGVAVD